jgi:hypothetical protein
MGDARVVTSLAEMGNKNGETSRATLEPAKRPERRWNLQALLTPHEHSVRLPGVDRSLSRSDILTPGEVRSEPPQLVT